MNKTLLSLATSAVLLTAPALAGATGYAFSGAVDDGPLAGQTFSGSFSFDDSSIAPGFEGERLLSAFSMTLTGQTYSLASADSAPSAVYYDGLFLGLSYTDVDAADPGLRPWVALLPGFTSLGEAYLAYETSGALSGYGSFSVAVVPEPASLALFLAGLAAVGGLAQQRRRRPV